MIYLQSISANAKLRINPKIGIIQMQERGLIPQDGSQKEPVRWGASAVFSQGETPRAMGVSPMSDWRLALPTCTPTGKQATRSVSPSPKGRASAKGEATGVQKSKVKMNIA